MQLDRIAGLRNAKGKNLFTRYKEGLDFLDKQKKLELWLYNRVILTGPSTEVLAMDDNNNIFYGVNFASADYLGLAKNEFARDAAI
jgi:glycine C-acetyltransferase